MIITNNINTKLIDDAMERSKILSNKIMNRYMNIIRIIRSIKNNINKHEKMNTIMSGILEIDTIIKWNFQAVLENDRKIISDIFKYLCYGLLGKNDCKDDDLPIKFNDSDLDLLKSFNVHIDRIPEDFLKGMRYILLTRDMLISKLFIMVYIDFKLSCDKNNQEMDGYENE